MDGVLPGSHGYRVLWDGLWADLVVGVSAENLVHRGEPRVQPSLLLHYLQHQLNSTQVGSASLALLGDPATQPVLARALGCSMDNVVGNTTKEAVGRRVGSELSVS